MCDVCYYHFNYVSVNFHMMLISISIYIVHLQELIHSLSFRTKSNVKNISVV